MYVTVLFILRSRLLAYSAVSGVNRVQVLSGISVRLFYFVQAKAICGYYMYFCTALVLVCVDLMVMASV